MSYFFREGEDFSAEIAEINRVCEADRLAREQNEIAVAIAASIELERRRKMDEDEAASIRLERRRKMEEAKRFEEEQKQRIKRDREYYDKYLAPGRQAEQMKYNSLVPSAGEAKVQCPWCNKAWLLEINCGIVHCGAERIGKAVVQLPQHAPAGAFTNRPLVTGCGRQFRYDRETGQTYQCTGR